MGFNPKDHYFKKAKKENFVARSIFKLEEIDQKYKLLKPGQRILDLGCAPGSWSQYCSKKVGLSGKVLGVDLSPVGVVLENATFIQADLNDLNLDEIFKEHGFDPIFDLVLSDMAPKTTGIRLTDQARSLELCELALNTARRFLRKGGHFVCKLFHSDDFSMLKNQIKTEFQKFEALKPESTRKISKEIFLVGMNKKNEGGVK